MAWWQRFLVLSKRPLTGTDARSKTSRGAGIYFPLLDLTRKRGSVRDVHNSGVAKVERLGTQQQHRRRSEGSNTKNICGVAGFRGVMLSV